jgi:hypothetical protein
MLDCWMGYGFYIIEAEVNSLFWALWLTFFTPVCAHRNEKVIA